MKPIHASRPGSGATASVAGLKNRAQPHERQPGSGANAPAPSAKTAGANPSPRQQGSGATARVSD